MIRLLVLTEVSAFLQATGMSITVLGRRCFNDGSFVFRFCAGSNPTLNSVENLRRYMAANWPTTAPLPDSLKPYLPPQEAAE